MAQSSHTLSRCSREFGEARRWCRAAGLLLVLGAAGCQATATGSVQANASGNAQANGSASASASAQGGLQIYFDRTTKRIEYRGYIEFDFDKDEPKQEQVTQKTLDVLCKYLEKNSKVKVRIEGHTDSRGSRDYNKNLSDRRAAAIRAYLTGKNPGSQCRVSADRMTSVGLGKDSPRKEEPKDCLDNKKPEDPDRCEREFWRENRKAGFQVVEGAETIKDEAPRPDDSPGQPSDAPTPSAQIIPRRWFLGAYLEASFPGGSISQGDETKSYLKYVESLGVLVGGWATPSVALGLDGEVGTGTSADKCPLNALPPCVASSSRRRLSAFVEIHPTPRPKDGVEPWIGFLLGIESLKMRLEGGNVFFEPTRTGPQLEVRGGLDFKPGKLFRLGPFLGLAAGQYGVGSPGNAPFSSTLSGSTAAHNWFSFGVRGVMDFL